MFFRPSFLKLYYISHRNALLVHVWCIHRTTIFSGIGTHYSSTEDVRMRWRTLGLRKTRCIGENPVFPQVIYRKKAWIFVTCLEQMLHNADYWAVTLNISKFCWDLSSTDIHRSLPPLHRYCSNYVPHFNSVFTLFVSNSIRHEPTSKASL